MMLHACWSKTAPTTGVCCVWHPQSSTLISVRNAIACIVSGSAKKQIEADFESFWMSDSESKTCALCKVTKFGLTVRR